MSWHRMRHVGVGILLSALIVGGVAAISWQLLIIYFGATGLAFWCGRRSVNAHPLTHTSGTCSCGSITWGTARVADGPSPLIAPDIPDDTTLPQDAWEAKLEAVLAEISQQIPDEELWTPALRGYSPDMVIFDEINESDLSS